MRIIAILALCLTLIACSKPDPNPELKDPIYSDLNALLATTTQALEAEKKTLLGHEKDLKEAIPQTGQIKFAQKRVGESKDKISRLEQEEAYLKLKIKARLKSSRASYEKAFETKAPWPDPQEWKTYEMEKKFRNAKKSWDVKERMKELGVGVDNTPKPAPTGGH